MSHHIIKEDYKDCLGHIEKQWEPLICTFRKDRFTQLGLPHPFVTPSLGIFKNDQFYWDSYFTITGLVKCGRVDLARGMVDNLAFLFNRFNIVPMRNRYYNIGTSQIPFLTSMAFEIFHETGNRKWLRKIMEVAERELKDYWMNKSLAENHLVYKGLSRYCDHYVTHLGAEHESGWDMTSRFNDHCLDYLPVDLNCCLFRYEMDIAETYHLHHDKKNESRFLSMARKRQAQMHSFFWNEKKGFFFDYDYRHKKQSTFYSLAGFYPLWANAATAAQAARVRDRLEVFEYKGGLANSQSTALSPDIKQHDYPNGWPQQHWIVIKGLLNYGYHEDALRIGKKWLDLNRKIYRATGEFWEKYNVVSGKIGKNNADRYPVQKGFGWTNAVFIRLVHELQSL
jgi:alpha,alpha-trehalase